MPMWRKQSWLTYFGVSRWGDVSLVFAIGVAAGFALACAAFGLRAWYVYPICDPAQGERP